MQSKSEKDPLRLGTRASDLAMTQSRSVASALKGETGRSIELVPIQSSGDAKRGAGESVARDKKDWILELEHMLLAGEIDFAVHSAKDVPIDIELETSLVSVLPRADARDALLLSGDVRCGASAAELLSALQGECVIASASKRRRAQVLRLGLVGSVVPIRGNVPTRIRKMKEQPDIDGLVLAYSGLLRLGLEKEVTALFEVDEMLPAVHQGTLCAQYLSGNTEMGSMLALISDSTTQLVWEAERSVIEKLGADCESCVGVYACPVEDGVRLRAQVLSSDGSRFIEETGVAPGNEVRKLGHGVGEALLRAGAADLL